MKLDMSAAWNDAVAMIKGNREVMTVIAGVFFFLPSVATLFFIEEPGELPPDADIETVQRYLIDFYGGNAVPFLLLTLASAVGFIALLALLRNDRKPTVGEAIASGFIGLLPYIGAQLIVGLGIMFLAGVLIGLPIAVGLQPIAFFTMLIVLVILIYVTIKVSLVMPVIAIERDMNPISVLRRSWTLTKGNSVRVFLFYLLLGLGFAVISAVIQAFSGLLFGLLGDGTTAEIANGSVAAVVSAAGSLVFAAVMAAIHRQLAGSTVDLVK
jgi:hypothetical protein